MQGGAIARTRRGERRLQIDASTSHHHYKAYVHRAWPGLVRRAWHEKSTV